jgi:hypothetical protein
MRAALYWAPALNDPLWQRGCAWLGRDAQTGATCAQPDVPCIGELTAQPRRYGFHATLRPPMRLATGWDEFRQAARGVAQRFRPFALPPLAVAEIGGFLALRESSPCADLQALADACVELTERHRLPASPEEIALRRQAGLSARQEEMLRRWGYPYVMQDWFFHLTLTRRLAESELARARAAAAGHFQSVTAMPRAVREICIFTQGAGDFMIAERCPLG